VTRSGIRQRPSRLRRLDDALAVLPLEDPMLLTELDGFLTGILVGPEPVDRDEWMQPIWGSDDGGVAPFEDPIDVQWFADAVMAHHDRIAHDLARGKVTPIFDVDERNGDLLWESWIDGLVEAIEFRPDAWQALGEGDDRDAAARMATLIAIARDESTLDSIEINAFQDKASSEIREAVLALYAVRCRMVPAPVAAVGAPPQKIGRNDPCRCGSGKKSKRCCG